MAVQPIKSKAVRIFEHFKDLFEPPIDRNPQPVNTYSKNAEIMSRVRENPSISAPAPSPVPQTLGAQYTPGATSRPQMNGDRMYGRNPDTTGAEENVYNAITNAAKRYNVEPALLFDIAMQESSLNPNAQNPEGTAGGLFQYLDSTWNSVMNQYANNPQSSLYKVLPNANKMDPVTNSLVTAYLIGHGQLGKWDESQNVWGKFWPEPELKSLGYYDQTLNRK